MTDVLNSPSGVGGESNKVSLPNWNELTAEAQLKILYAIDRMAKDNPDIVKQLTGLADVKENRPGTWKAGLKFLKLS